MIKKLLCKYEKNYFNKLIKKYNYIPVTQGKELLYIINAKLGKIYYPEFNKRLIIK